MHNPTIKPLLNRGNLKGGSSFKPTEVYTVSMFLFFLVAIMGLVVLVSGGVAILGGILLTYDYFRRLRWE